jgi:uncharacterized protein (TIGR03437 family)
MPSGGRVILAAVALFRLHAASTLTLNQDGLTVYDSANNITWLANANPAASNRFGMPACVASSTAAFTAPTQPVSPSFFVFNGGPYVAATHADGSLIGPTTLYPGFSTPAQPGETIVIYANGFGPTSVPVTAGSPVQSGTLTTLPVVQIGDAGAAVAFAGLVEPGQFQFNIVVPATLSDGDQLITATYAGTSTQSGALITIEH